MLFTIYHFQSDTSKKLIKNNNNWSVVPFDVVDLSNDDEKKSKSERLLLPLIKHQFDSC